MLQVFYGNGKGKTTAAIGGAIRALGADMNVLFIQFLKADNTSEIKKLSHINNIQCIYPSEKYTLFQKLGESDKERYLRSYNKMFIDISSCIKDYSMIVLDESITAYCMQLISSEIFLSFLKSYSKSMEIVLTGHMLPDEIRSMADYITFFKMEKHPYQDGKLARRGIEY